MRTLKRILGYAGAVCSAAVFLVGVWMAFAGWFSHSRSYWGVLSILIAALLLLALPVKWAIRYEESDFEPLMKESSAARKFSRGAMLALLAYTAFRQIGSLEWDYDLFLGLTLLLSWAFLMVYLYGPGMICSERFMAISRHPIFLFRRDLLKRYLMTKMRDAEVKDSNGIKL